MSKPTHPKRFIDHRSEDECALAAGRLYLHPDAQTSVVTD